MIINDFIRVTAVEGGAVILNMHSGQYWQVNPTAAHLIALITAGQSRDEILQAFSEFYPGVDPVQIRADVDDCISDLITSQVVGSSGHDVRKLSPGGGGSPGRREM